MGSVRFVLLASALLSVGLAWEFIRGEALTWEAAQVQCQARFGLDLAKVETLQEIADFVAITNTWDFPEHVWIGAKKDSAGSSTSHWVDNTPVATHYWRDGEPNTASDLCIHMWATHTPSNVAAGKVWNDASCNGAHRWAAACGLSDATPPPQCVVPSSEWLETEFEPVLDVAASGFTTGVTDEFQFAFDYHRKYYDETFSTGANAALETVATREYTPFSAGLGPCYDGITLSLAWGDLVPFCARDDISDPEFVIYTCKLITEGKEDLDPIRGEGLTRVVHNEIPVIVKFPKQVSASVSNLSAFKKPDLLAAIVRQEVNVDVSNLGVVAKTRIYTSVQYPFRLVNPAWDVAPPAGAPTTPAGINPGAAPTSVSDCGPPFPAGGDSPGQPGDAFACNQIWELDLDVVGGANPSASVCELDGDYYFGWQAVCVPTFPSDCPLVQDDQGQVADKYAIKFTLDSEYFCPQVVDEVDVAATLAVFKDLAHTIDASNFILGQTLYVVADVTSSKATVVGAQLDDLSYNRGPGAVDVVVDETALIAPALAAADALQSLVWYDAGATVPGGAVVPDNQVWVQFLVSNPPFLPPVDGSEDFSITATLNVQFKDATAMAMLLQANSQQVGASTTTSMSGAGDHETSSAVSVGVATAVASAAAGFAML